jgi:hypothetical protein
VKVPLAAARLRALRVWASLDSFYARELPLSLILVRLAFLDLFHGNLMCAGVVCA